MEQGVEAKMVEAAVFHRLPELLLPVGVQASLARPAPTHRLQKWTSGFPSSLALPLGSIVTI